MLYSPTVHSSRSSLKMQTKMTRLCMSVRSYNQTHYSYYESVKLLSVMSAVIHTLAPFTCLGWLSLIQQSTWQFVRMNNEAVIHSRPQFRNSQSVLGWHSFHISALSPVSQRPVTNKRKNLRRLRIYWLYEDVYCYVLEKSCFICPIISEDWITVRVHWSWCQMVALRY